MAPKKRLVKLADAEAAKQKALKGKGSKRKRKTAEEPVMFEEDILEKYWTPSSSTMENLTNLSRLGVLPSPALKVWRPPPESHKYPQPDHGEFVLFEDFVMRGVGLPVHPFLRDLCHYWKISLCNLDPNSVLAVSIFIGYCEMFLGILPHFNLFRYFYVLRLKGANLGGSEVAGGCYIRLRDGMKAHWLDIPYGTPNKDWSQKWFYASQDVADRLVPSDVVYIPKKNKRWDAQCSKEDMLQVEELLKLINTTNCSGPFVAVTWLSRRVQPCKERTRPLYEFSGKDDPSREPQAPWGQMTVELANAWVEVMFTRNFKDTYPKVPQKPYSVTNRPPPTIAGQDRGVYFSAIPLGDWPKGEALQGQKKRPRKTVVDNQTPSEESDEILSEEAQQIAAGKKPMAPPVKKSKSKTLRTGGKMSIGDDSVRATGAEAVSTDSDSSENEDTMTLNARMERQRVNPGAFVLSSSSKRRSHSPVRQSAKLPPLQSGHYATMQSTQQAARQSTGNPTIQTTTQVSGQEGAGLSGGPTVQDATQSSAQSIGSQIPASPRDGSSKSFVQGLEIPEEDMDFGFGAVFPESARAACTEDITPQGAPTTIPPTSTTAEPPVRTASGQGEERSQNTLNEGGDGAAAYERAPMTTEGAPATIGLVVGSGPSPAAAAETVRGNTPPIASHNEVSDDEGIEEISRQDAGEVPVQRVQTYRRVGSVVESYEEINTGLIGPIIDRLLSRVRTHVQSLEETAEQRRRTINRLAPVYEESEELKRTMARMEKQIQEHQTRENQWTSEKASLMDRVSELEGLLVAAQSQVTPLEAANQELKELNVKKDQELERKDQELDQLKAQLTSRCNEVEETKRRLLTQAQSAKKNIEVLQNRLKAMMAYMKPVVQSLFAQERWPADVTEADAILDRCRRLWPQVKHFVKEAAVFTASNVLVRVKSHYPTVEQQRFAEGVAAGTTQEQLQEMRAAMKPAAEAIVKNITFFKEPAQGSQSGQ